MKKYISSLGIAGLLSAVYGIVSAVLWASTVWFSYYIIGGIFFLAWLNYLLKNDSLFIKGKTYIFKTYGLYLFFMAIIEIVGRFTINFWEYPAFDFQDEIIHVFAIGYPFVFAFFHELFKIIRPQASSYLWAIVITILIGAFATEISNTYA